MYSIKNSKTTALIHADNIEETALTQISRISLHPSLYGLIAIMPDVHAGKGCVIGLTCRFKNSIIPSVIGVDLGCGVITYKLPHDIELDLPSLYEFINENIPSGFKSHTFPLRMNREQRNVVMKCERLVKSKNLKAKPLLQAGTLGSGNHFIEVECSPTTNDRYITIHSGSRKFGLVVANYYQAKAKKLLKDMHINVPEDLEYLPMNMGGKEYYEDMQLAQEYAHVNRMLMLLSILDYLNIKYDQNNVIESVHNYISKRDQIARKGAISAHLGEKVVIPLNMGKDGGIVLGEGLGNKKYNNSAPHGAGRIIGRKELKRQLNSGKITMNTFEESMIGVYTNVCENIIDEAPLAYKPLSAIEKYLKETVKIVDIARPIMSFKSID